MGAWGTFFFLVWGNEGFTLVRDTGVGMNIKRKLFSIYFLLILYVSQKLGLETRRSGNLRFYRIL